MAIINGNQVVFSATVLDENGYYNKTEIDALLEDLNPNGLPIGTIISSAVVLKDAGLHLLDGSSLATDGIYAEFCTWLTEKYNADNSSVPTCTESEWQNEVNTFGQCGKFVIGGDYVRLPKITKFIEGISNISDIGTSLGAGLPNITGEFYNDLKTNADNTSYLGAFSPKNTTHAAYSNRSSQSGSSITGFTFDASISNSIYGNSDTVQPQATKYPYYIVVATMTKTDVEVNLDNVASDLNLKANNDLGNVSYAQLTPDGQVHTGGGYTTYMSSDGATWYIIHPNGLKECWLTKTGSTNGGVTVTLPIEFSNTYYKISYGTYGASVTTAVMGAKTIDGTKTTNSFQLVTTYASATGVAYYNISVDIYCCGY